MNRFMMMLMLFIAFVVVAIVINEAFADEYSLQNSSLTTQGRITKIKDGDTFEIKTSDGVHICRLVGIDTPEKFKGRKLTADVNKTGIRPIVHLEAGLQATEYANEYFSKRYSPDVNVIFLERDLYGRDLCIIGSIDRGDVSVQNSYNCDILLDGYAVFYKLGKNLKKTMREEFKECDARDSGLWETMPTLMEGLLK